MRSLKSIKLKKKQLSNMDNYLAKLRGWQTDSTAMSYLRNWIE
jgi:hypothetical protein